MNPGPIPFNPHSAKTGYAREKISTAGLDYNGGGQELKIRIEKKTPHHCSRCFDMRASNFLAGFLRYLKSKCH